MVDFSKPIKINKEETKEPIKDISDEVDRIIRDREIDPEFIKKHLPKDGYMKVELKKAIITSETPDKTIIKEHAAILPLGASEPVPEGECVLVDPKTGKKHKIAIYDTVFRTDLRTLIQSQLYECPSTVFPTIVERLVQTALNEKNAKYPEKRSDKKDWFWLIILIMVPVLIVIALIMFSTNG